MTILESLKLTPEQKRQRQEDLIENENWHVDYTVRGMGRDALLLASAESDNQ